MEKAKKVKVKVLSEGYEHVGKKVRKGRVIEVPAKDAGVLVDSGHVQYLYPDWPYSGTRKKRKIQK